MAETEIKFHNKTEIRVQAQIFAGRTLICTTFVDPGETGTLPVRLMRFDIFFKNSATGWEIARKLDSGTRKFTLSRDKSRYAIHEANDDGQLASTAKPKTSVNKVAN